MPIYNPSVFGPDCVKVPLAVVTFTDGTRAESLAKCIASVTPELPGGAVHYIIPTRGLSFYAHQREEALRLGDVVTFVDDDDIVLPGALARCYSAIQSSNYGVAFTDEALVDEAGKVLKTREGVRTYENVKRSAQAIHHLALIRSSSVKDDLVPLRGRVKGVDWWILTSAIKNSVGAIHVPMIGYHWTQTPGSTGKSKLDFPLPDVTFTQTGPIPVWA